MRHKIKKDKIMNKLTIFILALSLTIVSCSDNEGVNKAFSKYGHKEGVTAISVPGFVIHLASSFGELEEQEKDLLRNIDLVKVLAIENDHLNEEINLHNEFYEKINQNNEFEELLVVSSEGQNITIYGKVGKNEIIKEMVILVGGEDNALVYLKGNLDPKLLNKYIDLSNPNDFLSLNL